MNLDYLNFFLCPLVLELCQQRTLVPVCLIGSCSFSSVWLLQYMEANNTKLPAASSAASPQGALYFAVNSCPWNPIGKNSGTSSISGSIALHDHCKPWLCPSQVGWLCPQGTFSNVQREFGLWKCLEGGFLAVAGQDAAKHPIMYRTVPYKNTYLAQNVNNGKFQEPCSIITSSSLSQEDKVEGGEGEGERKGSSLSTVSEA